MISFIICEHDECGLVYIQALHTVQFSLLYHIKTRTVDKVSQNQIFNNQNTLESWVLVGVQKEAVFNITICAFNIK